MKIRDRDILKRKPIDEDPAYRERVNSILSAVRAQGDAAVKSLTATYDHVDLEDLFVSDLKNGMCQPI